MSPLNERRMDFITEAGLKNLKAELTALELERPIVAKDLDEARKQGDLSENAGYHAAKSRLAQIDKRISYLRKQIGECKIIKITDAHTVQIGSYVKVLVSGKAEPAIIRIVGEGDLLDNDEAEHVMSITFSSNVARALLGKSTNDTVVVYTPAGEREYTILEISIEEIAK